LRHDSVSRCRLLENSKILETEIPKDAFASLIHGKTTAARRVLPMTPRVRGILEGRWEAVGKPAEGWAWPAPTRSGHIESSSLKKQHLKAFELIAREAATNNVKPVRPFVLYSLRHTFLTSERRGCACSYGKTGWAQIWAQQQST
jgi:integrase